MWQSHWRHAVDKVANTTSTRTTSVDGMSPMELPLSVCLLARIPSTTWAGTASTQPTLCTRLPLLTSSLASTSPPLAASTAHLISPSGMPEPKMWKSPNRPITHHHHHQEIAANSCYLPSSFLLANSQAVCVQAICFTSMHFILN